MTLSHRVSLSRYLLAVCCRQFGVKWVEQPTIEIIHEIESDKLPWRKDDLLGRSARTHNPESDI